MKRERNGFIPVSNARPSPRPPLARGSAASVEKSTAVYKATTVLPPPSRTRPPSWVGARGGRRHAARADGKRLGSGTTKKTLCREQEGPGPVIGAAERG